MRKYAHLTSPLKYDGDQFVYKIMFYQTQEELYLFGYFSPEAVQCSFDRRYDSLKDIYEEWNDLIDEKGWIEIEDPLPDCQHDAFIPVRVKGRDTGKPEWGNYETLKDGRWVEYRVI